MLLFFVLVCMSTSTCDVWFSSITGVGDSAHSFVPALALAHSFRWKLMLWRDNFILYLSLAWRDEVCWLAPWAPILSNLEVWGQKFYAWQGRKFDHEIPLGGNLGGQAENVCPLGQKKGRVCQVLHCRIGNPGGAISIKNVIFPIQGAQFWLKMSYFVFPTQGAGFWSNVSYLQPRGAQF